MYAYLAAATGWTFEYIGQCMTLPRLYAMNDAFARLHGVAPKAEPAPVDKGAKDAWISSMPKKSAGRRL